MTTDLKLVEIAKALRDVWVKPAAIHVRSISARCIHYRYNGTVHANRAVHSAHPLLFDHYMALLSAADEGLGTDNAVGNRGVVAVDNEQDECIRRSEGSLPRRRARRPDGGIR